MKLGETNNLKNKISSQKVNGELGNKGICENFIYL